MNLILSLSDLRWIFASVTYLLVILRSFVSLLFFFFKQKTAYEMRISDWSSDVCSSDLPHCPDCRDLPRIRRELLWRDLCRRLAGAAAAEIGRASCRERVCQYV